MNELASLQLRVDSTDVNDAQQQLGGLAAAGARAERATDRLTDKSKKFAQQTAKTTGNVRLMKGGVQQLGYQVQDIAVQLQSGTNAMVVFGQQGSQILSIFGPAGAIAGAVVAIGAAVGGTLLKSLFDSKSATDRLEESLDLLDSRAKIVEVGIVSLSKEIRELAKTSGAAAALELQTGIVAGLETIEAAAELASEKLDDFISPGFLNDSKYVTEAFKTLGAQQRDAADVLEAFANDNDRYWKIVQEDARGTMQSVQDVSTAYINLNHTVGELEKKYGATRTEAIALAQAFSRVQDDKSLAALQGLQAALDDIADNKGASAEVLKFASELRKTVIEAEKAGIKVEAFKEQLDRLGKGLGLSDPEEEKKALDAFERIESRLAQQVALYGQVGAAAQVRYQVENNLIEGLNEEQGKILIGLAEELDAKKRIEDATKARDRELKQYQSIEERLSSQAALYGVVSEEVKIRYQLENGLLGELDAAQQQNLLNLGKEIDLKRRIAAETKQAERDAKEGASALAGLEDYLRSEEELIEKSHARRRQIILENTEAGSKHQEELLLKLNDKTASELERLNDTSSKFAEQAASNMQDAFADFLFDPFNEGLDGMLEGFLRTIQRMLAEAAAAKALEGLFGAVGTGGAAGTEGLIGSGGFGKSLSSLLSFDGGGYTGSGSRSGGADGKGGFLAMMHPNETVIDHNKPSNRQPSPSNQNITINVLPAENTQQARMTGQQVARQSFGALARANRRF